uniref:N-acetylglucosamine-1-phosphate uridyltransferase / Glucosamine-1-phosphate N-acetyltransferase n=1 Tax=Loigolactobacillus rennini TaxID=238013 RepID=A0A1K2I5Z0_9LACO|nr:N-acetylglucosamine-1-phosphate uridyltransferase / Glucosamine-1-phosphate N-acetyltransferase [Loigolactobacillus rennini]
MPIKKALCQLVWIEAIKEISSVNAELVSFLENFEREYKVLTGTEKPYISKKAHISDQAEIEGLVYIEDDVTVQPFAHIKGPVIIRKGTLIGKSAFVRDGTYIGRYTIIGHSSEIINSIVMDHSSIAHFNTITKSIVGNYVNFSSYASTSSFNLNESITDNGDGVKKRIFLNQKEFVLTQHKFGSIVGDGGRIGAYSMMYPGVTLGRNCLVLPHLMIREGFYPDNTELYLKDYYSHTIERKR